MYRQASPLSVTKTLYILFTVYICDMEVGTPWSVQIGGLQISTGCIIKKYICIGIGT